MRLRKPASSTTLCTYTSQASAAVADPTITTVQARMRAVNRAQYTTQTTVFKEPVVHSSFEDKTGTWQYVVADPATNRAVVIDPVLDYDANTQTISTQTADDLLATISENGYHIEKILETHAHADHLTAASYLQQRLSSQQGFRPPICIGKRIREVQARFAARYGIAAMEYENAFDHLFEDDEVFEIGKLEVKVMHLPGHTPDHIGYRIGGNVFCGDSIFHADIGTARCDFPGGSAKSLYASARKLLELPDDVKVWTGHDYPACPERCEAVPWMTVRDHKEKNKHLANDAEEDDFLTLRKERDASLAAPKLLHPSLQINIRAGRLPQPTSGDQRLMHLPIRISGTTW
ncbi:hypothetical protein AA0119_g12617 [Alternaria tenuissima]|uniref:Metallo-beta-lactamase domain-containing protein n=2 Tax=Alternaria alternata complex TaxID=187734 RepID=A0A4Q4MBE9_9PLEO|nr:hypothetical protein AA0114_g8682 [Alternaria tenuissima]RYN74683.1 hypothetical protein AA0120_g12266 [Alternaria tenuissima]RYN87167.1 hypothetical protein AA0119_g12617 [Alternaria tenuissima]RYO12810.1 hypothetical protein AA0121_g8946 [Alternaria tenuissima]